MSQSPPSIHVLRRAIAIASLGAAAGLLAPTNSLAASQADQSKGPLTGAESVQISITEKTGGTLAFLLPLPDSGSGSVFPWSKAEVETRTGSCEVQLRRDREDPGHDLELELVCKRFTPSFRVTELRLNTTHRFQRKKETIAEFTHSDGATTIVRAAVK